LQQNVIFHKGVLSSSEANLYHVRFNRQAFPDKVTGPSAFISWSKIIILAFRRL